MSLTILDYSDREILWKVADTLDENGETNATALCISMGLHESEGRNIAIRLAWMRRFGVIEKTRVAEGKTFFTLSAEGREMLDGDLGAMAKRSLEGISPAQRVTLMEQLALHGKDHPLWKTMMRRQWQNTTGNKKGL